MKILHCDSRRDEIQKTVYSCGEFAYEYISDFARNLPDNVANASIAGGCTDQEGNVYLGMRGNPSQIVKLAPDGTYMKGFGGELLGDYLHFIKYTPQNTILCTDTHNHIVREFDTDGTLIRDFGEAGKPSDTGMDMGTLARMRRDGKIFPTEPYLGIVGMWAFYEAQRRVKRVAGPFNMPTDVDMTSSGEYIFADGYGNRAVHIFNADGTYRKTFGGVGDWEKPYEDTPGDMLIVHALCVDERDHIWICDREKDAEHVCDTDGNEIGYCSNNMGMPSGVDTDGEYIYVVGRAGYLTVFDLDMNMVAQLGTFNSDLRAHDLAANKQGDLFLFPTHANEDHQVIKLRRIRK